MEKKKKNINDYIAQALEHINEDRGSASTLLNDLMWQIKKNSLLHEKNGIVAAKYLETLQRSNEQLVKLIELMRKRKDVNENFGEDDVENLLDQLAEEQKSGA